MNLKAVTINEKPEPKKNKQFSGGFLPTQVLVTSSLFPSLNGDQNQNKNDRMHNSDEIVEPYHPSAIESVNDSTSNSSNSHYVYDEAIDDEFTMSHDTPFPIPPMDLSHAFQFLQQANLCNQTTSSNATKVSPKRKLSPINRQTAKRLNRTSEAAILLTHSPLATLPAIPGAMAVAASPAAKLFGEGDWSEIWSWHRNPAAAIRYSQENSAEGLRKLEFRSGGTNKQTPVWKYFVYNKAENLSRCIVGDCTYMLKGPHTSTLACHLKKHTEEYAEFQRLKNEYSRERNNSSVKDDSEGGSKNQKRESKGEHASYSSSSSSCSSLFGTPSNRNNLFPEECHYPSSAQEPSVKEANANAKSENVLPLYSNEQLLNNVEGFKNSGFERLFPFLMAKMSSDGNQQIPTGIFGQFPTSSIPFNHALPSMMHAVASQFFPFSLQSLAFLNQQKKTGEIDNIRSTNLESNGEATQCDSPQMDEQPSGIRESTDSTNEFPRVDYKAKNGNLVLNHSVVELLSDEHDKRNIKSRSQSYELDTQDQQKTTAKSANAKSAPEAIEANLALSISMLPPFFVETLLHNPFFSEFSRQLQKKDVFIPSDPNDIQKMAEKYYEDSLFIVHEILKNSSAIIVMVDVSCTNCEEIRWWENGGKCKGSSGFFDDSKVHNLIICLSAICESLGEQKAILLGVRPTSRPSDNCVKHVWRTAEEILSSYSLDMLGDERLSYFIVSWPKALLPGNQGDPVPNQVIFSVYPECLESTINFIFENDHTIAHIVDELCNMSSEQRSQSEFIRQCKFYYENGQWRSFIDALESILATKDSFVNSSYMNENFWTILSKLATLLSTFRLRIDFSYRIPSEIPTIDLVIPMLDELQAILFSNEFSILDPLPSEISKELSTRTRHILDSNAFGFDDTYLKATASTVPNSKLANKNFYEKSNEDMKNCVENGGIHNQQSSHEASIGSSSANCVRNSAIPVHQLPAAPPPLKRIVNFKQMNNFYPNLHCLERTALLMFNHNL